uniref:Uncharacterized protein n=1 Tax=Medicago truncatula TaxID=3880 RepID=I3SZQ4_MEDTR|nr:unknown [Medicago truncatula]
MRRINRRNSRCFFMHTHKTTLQQKKKSVRITVEIRRKRASNRVQFLKKSCRYTNKISIQRT